MVCKVTMKLGLPETAESLRSACWLFTVLHDTCCAAQEGEAVGDAEREH